MERAAFLKGIVLLPALAMLVKPQKPKTNIRMEASIKGEDGWHTLIAVDYIPLIKEKEVQIKYVAITADYGGV